MNIKKDQPMAEETREAIDRERYEVLQQVEDWLEWPVLALGFVWIILLVVELIWGLNAFLQDVIYIIWAIFVLDFVVRFVLAPKKGPFIKNNILTLLSLAVPALRILRIARLARLMTLARTTRGLRLFRLVSSLNRGMRALRASMGRRGFGFVSLLTLLVILAGSAGIYALEGGGNPGSIFQNYGDALWWTAMILTTMGSEQWPQSGEGRLLTLMLSIYAFSVFGYFTAVLATYFLGQEAENDEAEIAGVKSIEALRKEIALLRAELNQNRLKPEEGATPE